MKKILSISILICCISVLSAQTSYEKELQTQLILVEDGETVDIKEGMFQMSGSLAMDGKKNIIIQGKGMDKSILSFKNQERGAEGIKITNGVNITVKDLTIQDSKGDCIKVQETDGITFVNVKVEWTGKPNKKNGAYGLYPVQCNNVLIDGCEAIGASDAGIYVGQSDKIIVRNSRAFQNVAGIEIENSTNADVYNNLTEGNTGGILVFDLPDLMKKKGGHVRVFNNKIIANNYKNFAPKGNIVATVPPGTGILILATSDVEIFDNQIVNNRTVGTGVVSYLYTGIPIKDKLFDPYPKRIYIHHNAYSKSNNKPILKSDVGKFLFLKFGKNAPNILYDGVPKDDALEKNGQLKPDARICLKNNEKGTFLNLNAKKGLKYYNTDTTLFDCELPSLQATDLANN